MNNIIVVCDENKTCEALKSKLMLLRKIDSIFACDFLSSKQIINQNPPSLIILYSNIVDKKLLDFIKNFNQIPILFVADNISDDELLSIYDAGIFDYIYEEKSPAEFLIKVMSCLKHSLEIKKYKRSSDILTHIGILKKGTEFFSSKYTPAVFKTLIKLHKDTNLSIMAIAPDISFKNKMNLDILAKILKENLREDDIIGFCTEKLYVLLPNTSKQGALDVYNKIKNSLENTITCSAGILEIEKNMTFDYISDKVNEALTDALLLKNSVVVQENLINKIPMNWLDKSNKKHKNFKLFKKALLKKIETAVAPVFFQKQQILQQRLFEVEVEQFSNEKESRFTLKKDGVYSVFELTYPGAVKMELCVCKNIFKNTPYEYKSFDLPEVNEKLINELLDEFVKDFSEEQ